MRAKRTDSIGSDVIAMVNAHAMGMREVPAPDAARQTPENGAAGARWLRTYRNQLWGALGALSASCVFMAAMWIWKTIAPALSTWESLWYTLWQMTCWIAAAASVMFIAAQVCAMGRLDK